MDSIQTSWHSFSRSHDLKSKIELLKVENRRRFNAGGSFDDCGNKKRFVNLDTTTGLISNFHSVTTFVKDKKPLPELPHNKTKSFNNS